MLDSIKSVYNELPANLWEYQELFNSLRVHIAVFLFLVIFVLLLKNHREARKLKKIISDIPELEVNRQLIEEVKKNSERSFNLEIMNKATEENIKQINNKLKNIYRSETVEYNPYKDTGVGGKLSFSTAFLTENGDGVILTSLYARDRNRLLIKEITNYISEKELAPEEKEVLAKFEK